MNIIIINILTLALLFLSVPAHADWLEPLSPKGIGNDELVMTWRCPANTNNYLKWSNTNSYQLNTIINNQSLPVNEIDTPLFSSYLGISTFPQRNYKWYKSNILITKYEDYGVGVLDFNKSRCLFDNVYQSIIELPGYKFVVLPLKPSPRHDSFDYMSYHDTIGLIDPENLNLTSNSANPDDHLAKKRVMPGVITSPLVPIPNINQNKSLIAFFILIGSNMHLMVIDGNNLQTVKDLLVPNVPVPHNILIYGGVDKSVKEKIMNLIAGVQIGSN